MIHTLCERCAKPIPWPDDAHPTDVEACASCGQIQRRDRLRAAEIRAKTLRGAEAVIEMLRPTARH